MNSTLQVCVVSMTFPSIVSDAAKEQMLFFSLILPSHSGTFSRAFCNLAARPTPMPNIFLPHQVPSLCDLNDIKFNWKLYHLSESKKWKAACWLGAKMGSQSKLFICKDRKDIKIECNSEPELTFSLQWTKRQKNCLKCCSLKNIRFAPIFENFM